MKRAEKNVLGSIKGYLISITPSQNKQHLKVEFLTLFMGPTTQGKEEK